MGTDFSRQSGKSDWGGRRGAAVPSGVFSGRIVKVAWKNAIWCVWKSQIHYILMLAAFWYILKGCKIVARKRYQRHVFVQIAQEKAGNPNISGRFLVEVTGLDSQGLDGPSVSAVLRPHCGLIHYGFFKSCLAPMFLCKRKASSLDLRLFWGYNIEKFDKKAIL